jgi:hypothetical protein
MMNWKRIAILFAALATAAAAADAGVRLVSSAGRRTEFELVVDSVSLLPATGGMALRADGLFGLEAPGEPDLPGRIVMVGVPQQGAVRVSASPSGTVRHSGVTLRPVADFAGRTAQSAVARIKPVAELLSVEELRGRRVARVLVRGASYDAGTGELAVHDRVRVTVETDADPVARSWPDALDPVFERLLVNGAQAAGWKLAPLLPDSVNFFARFAEWCRVRTETTGVYRVTPAELQSAGFSPDLIDPATLRLFALGPHALNGPYPDTMMEVPIHVVDNGDGKFSGSDYVAFYAEAPSGWRAVDSAWQVNPLTRHSTFWLTWGAGPGRRLAELSGAGATNGRRTARQRVRLEEDLLCPARSGLLWLWTSYYKASGTAPAESSLSLALPGRDTIVGLRGRFYGRYYGNGSVQYQVMVLLNGALLDTVSMTAREATPPPADFTVTSIPAGAAARPGLSDSLAVRLFLEREEDVFLDWLEVEYARSLELAGTEQLEFVCRDSSSVDYSIGGADATTLLLDVTDPFNPKRVVSGAVAASRLEVRLWPAGRARYWCAQPGRLRTPAAVERRTPGGLRASDERADYYIICPDEFYDVAQSLVRHRQGNIVGIENARVRAVRRSEVEDDYAFGWAEPGAIKGLLRAKTPAYALLAGDGTYDYRNILRLAAGPGVPPFETGEDIDPEVYGRSAKALDAWYADFEGTGNSPDLILGRITPKSVVEFRSFVDKLKAYETQPAAYWMKRFILLADDEYLGTVTRPDPIGFQHITGSEAIGRAAGNYYDLVKLYLTEWQLGDRSRSAVALENELGRGALFWCFYGHGAGFQLCHEKSLEIAKVRSLRAGLRQAFAYFGSCGVGRFDDTRYESIAEDLARFEQGCIATVGATKATESGGNEALAGAMFGHFFASPGDPLGVGFYIGSSTYNTLYHLFGDPTMVLRIPQPGTAPAVTPDTLYPGGRNFVAGPQPESAGWYGMSARELDWFRRYNSDAGTVSYFLPGYEVGRANGDFDSALVRTSFVVPRISYPDTMPAGDGIYVRQPNSGRVSLLSWNSAGAWSSYVNRLPLSRDTAAKTDYTPPEITLYAGATRLAPGETTAVQSSFDLTAVISDQSGIMLVPLADIGLSLSVGGGARTDMTPFFAYDRNSVTTGRFSYPVKLARTKDSLAVVASDNSVDPSSPAQNRRMVTAYVRTLLDDQIRIDSGLVYPNPVAYGANPAARFTFKLTRGANVAVRIYTIGGRLVRSIAARPYQFGFNAIEWDGLDNHGLPLANGIYLYRLDARGMSGSQQTSAGYTDKLIISR